MAMARSHRAQRTFAALILLSIMIVVFTSLGNWQLRRAALRQSTMQTMQEGRNSPPLRLDPHTGPADIADWRPATATGSWLNEFTVLLENRNFNGRPGYWVATPLLLDPATRTAVLVLRGWLERPILPGSAVPPVQPAPDGTRTVHGELRRHVPRVFELWTFSGKSASVLPAKLPVAGGALPHVQNLELEAMARACGLKLLPGVLEQTSNAQDGLERDWPQPSTDAHKNRGYALQWFSFAAIAAGAWLVVAWRAFRRGKRRRIDDTPPK